MIKIAMKLLVLFLVFSSHANADKHVSKSYIEQYVKDMSQKSNNKKLMDESTCHVETIVHGVSIILFGKCSGLLKDRYMFEAPND